MNSLQARAIIALAGVWCALAYPRQAVDFRAKMGRWPRPAFPVFLNDKYAWRKIFDRNPAFTELSDKLKAKDHALRTCADVQVAKTLWTGQDAADIPDDILKRDVVVKTNNASGRNVHVVAGRHERGDLNRQANDWLRAPYGRRHAEWAYDGVEPKLFVEELLFDAGQPLANEYKFYVAGDRVGYVFARQAAPDGNGRIDGAIDADGTVHAGLHDGGVLCEQFHTPAEFERLSAAALQLSAGLDFVRCDLYLVDGEIYFSEMTFYSAGGYCWVSPAALTAACNEAWDLRRSWFMQTPQTGWRRLYARALRVMLEAGHTHQPDPMTQLAPGAQKR